MQKLTFRISLLDDPRIVVSSEDENGTVEEICELPIDTENSRELLSQLKGSTTKDVTRLSTFGITVDLDRTNATQLRSKLQKFEAGK